MCNKTVALNKLNNLKNKKLQYIKRSCDLIQFGFGDLIKTTNHKNEEIVVSAYTLHVQCTFRITDENGLLVGYNDLFYSAEDDNNIVNLSTNNGTIFDLKLQGFNEALCNEYVTNVAVNNFGDLTLLLSNYCISIFIDCSIEDEQWRFFKTKTNEEHLIVTGCGFEFC